MTYSYGGQAPCTSCFKWPLTS
ncbi:hypothetical protein SAM23877_1084 [Streptomyces ambofaciens ATCC 23877]|uniref:Uncharacterized protein n=1 Tax=Streptomyces ambofaciens (strain ATCC 23877 / 3486 / DSM 40053 / JCM 4204 / NBRC 12836 / NRRL B-2516) TaxID=278992 RepID=A0A0K2AMB0_STRA7|nr:hypothetical protein SAM23877_1084 [Streptomyces ambofaciens ATCC 23877]